MENNVNLTIPTSKTITLSDAEKFVEGLKQLKDICNLASVEFTPYGIVAFYFEDNSCIGSVGACVSAGYIDPVTAEKVRRRSH